MCERSSALVEVLAPGELPDGYEGWSDQERQAYEQHQHLESWRFRYADPGGYNGYGDTITVERATLLIEVYSPPIAFDRLDETEVDAAICLRCRKPYCSRHWSISDTGYGRCPEGHGKSLDPHWSPVD